MDKKKIYMVQVDHLYGNEEKSIYLPYAAGQIAAYAFLDTEIKSKYSLAGFVFWREDIGLAIDSLDSPFLIGFSNYVWNTEYNKAFAKRLKEKYPQCIVVFGGHNVPNNTSMLEQFPYIDILVHGEGEEAFKALLLAFLNSRELSEIPNISFRNSQNEIVKTPAAKPGPVSDYPSPYLEGIFDSVIKDSNFNFCAVIETNRGCPHHCSYCDWGSLGSQLRLFPMERIRKEIEWMAENKIDYFWCADSSFGILKRDHTIIDWLIELKQKTGYPKVFKVNYAENREQDVYEICRKLNKIHMNKGATLSFQSLDSKVLENIGRKNITMERFSEIMALYNESNIATYCELILGLPGETYETFCRGINTLLKAGQHNALNLHALVLLPNSRMSEPEYIQKFGIKTVRAEFSQFHCEKSGNEVPEYYNLVIETSSMDFHMWVQSTLFFIYIQSFHQLGLLQFFAIYLFYEMNIRYDEFYRRLIGWSVQNKESICGKIYTEFSRKLSGILQGNGSRTYINEHYGDIVWPLEEGAFLDILPRFEQFYEEIQTFLNGFGIKKDIYADLLNYQKGMVKLPGKKQVEIVLEYDIYNYFNRVYVHTYRPLEEKRNVLRLCDKNSADTWKEYAIENVWYGRNDGRVIFSDINQRYI